MSKYATLVNILDKLRSEAPREFKTYHALPSEIEKLDFARSRAFIHLFLKVRYGLLDFIERNKFITDGSYDGGVDAFYIDESTKTISLIQSKFRTTESNFEEKQIELKEILKMDCDRIAKGLGEDEDGNKYNGKIQGFIEKVQQLPDPARFKWQIVILANLKNVKPSDLWKLTGGISAEVFDFTRTYRDLVFPVVSGTFFNVADLFISLNLTNRELSQSRINYAVTTEHASCKITILFVPTIEIAKILHRYKNSVLKFNPRSFLELQENPVNSEIANTIKSKKTNEFALYNNGITVLSDDTNLSENIGKEGKGQLHIKNPQIINGGQTAFTLCRIYEELKGTENADGVFQDKEVMLKVITLPPEQSEKREKLLLIEEISKATNQQTAVDEADRRSNDKAQIELQENLFFTFGYFYERKRGEFSDGLINEYIDTTKIIGRETILRICCALKGQVSEARRQGTMKFFTKSAFDKLLDGAIDYKTIFYAYKCFEYLFATERTFAPVKNNKFGVANYGQGLRYGKYAITTVVSQTYSAEIPICDYQEKIKEETDIILSKWLDFESYIKQQTHNESYFVKTIDVSNGQETLEANFSGYYKGSTLDKDLSVFFKLSPEWEEGVMKGWKDGVKDAIVRLTKSSGNNTFTRKQLIESELGKIISEVGSSGKTPEQTLSRILQSLRNEKFISFESAGVYKLAIT